MIKKTMIKTKKAFSLLEVIFVLVILGIVASISSQIIVQVYENYITQKAIYNTSIKTELAINQIVNRLTYAIDGSTITKDPLNPPYSKTTEGTNWLNLKSIDLTLPNHRKFISIEWIGYDNDSFSAGANPYWSGVANQETASKNDFDTVGSSLGDVSSIVSNLSNSKVDLSPTKPAAVIFIEESGFYTDSIKYDPACMGLVNEMNTTCIFPVRRGIPNGTNLVFTRLDEPKRITERYKLAWSAYALVPEENSYGLHNLYLYSNYQPWNNEKYTDGSKNLLISNISVFKFTENGGVIQIKLCASEELGQDFNISSCKEKVIIR